MIVIKEIKESPVNVYHNANLIGEIDSIYQFNDIKIQVMEQKLEGVYFIWKDQNNQERQINCLTDGKCDDNPNGFFDVLDNQFTKLCGWDK